MVQGKVSSTLDLHSIQMGLGLVSFGGKIELLVSRRGRVGLCGVRIGSRGGCGMASRFAGIRVTGICCRFWRWASRRLYTWIARLEGSNLGRRS